MFSLLCATTQCSNQISEQRKHDLLQTYLTCSAMPTQIVTLRDGSAKRELSIFGSAVPFHSVSKIFSEKNPAVAYELGIEFKTPDLPHDVIMLATVLNPTAISTAQQMVNTRFYPFSQYRRAQFDHLRENSISVSTSRTPSSYSRFNGALSSQTGVMRKGK